MLSVLNGAGLKPRVRGSIRCACTDQQITVSYVTSTHFIVNLSLHLRDNIVNLETSVYPSLWHTDVLLSAGGIYTHLCDLIHVRFYNLVTKRQKNIHPHLYRHTQCIRSPFFTIFIRRHGRRAPLRQPYVLYYIILYQVHEYSIIICTRYNIIYRIV